MKQSGFYKPASTALIGVFSKLQPLTSSTFKSWKKRVPSQRTGVSLERSEEHQVQDTTAAFCAKSTTSWRSECFIADLKSPVSHPAPSLICTSHIPTPLQPLSLPLLPSNLWTRFSENRRLGKLQVQMVFSILFNSNSIKKALLCIPKGVENCL